MNECEFTELGLPVGAAMPGWTGRPVPPRSPMTGRFCRLEPLDPAQHGDDLHAANAADTEGRMWTYLPYGPFADASAYRAWLDSVAPGQDPLFFAIVPALSGRASGLASYLRLDPENGVIEIGHLACAPSLQRTPATTEAIFLMLERVFDLGYRRCEWKCHGLNRASRVAAQRLGFSYEGTFRQLRIVKGRTRDTAWFSILDREWPALREAYRRWLDPANFDADGRQRAALSTLTAPLLSARDPAGGAA